MNNEKIVSVEVEEEDSSTGIVVNSESSSEESRSEESSEETQEEESEEETSESSESNETHEEVNSETETHEETQEETQEENNRETDDTFEINDESAFSWMREKFGLGEDVDLDRVTSMLSPEEDPEDVEAFKKFKRETGGSLSDFVRIQRDFGSVGDDELIFDYIKSQNPTFSDDDVRLKMSHELEIDEDNDFSDSEINAKKLRKKEYYGKALNYFESEQEKFKTSLDQRGSEMTEEDRNLFMKYKQEIESEPERAEMEQKRRTHFANETEGLFSSNFDGFEFNLSDDLTAKFNIENVDAVKETQMSAMNFISSHLDENGMLKDAGKYHKQMYAASNINEIVKWAFDHGMTTALENQEKESKNIDMTHRKKPETVSKGGITVEVEDSGETGSGLKIKK